MRKILIRLTSTLVIGAFLFNTVLADLSWAKEGGYLARIRTIEDGRTSALVRDAFGTGEKRKELGELELYAQAIAAPTGDIPYVRTSPERTDQDAWDAVTKSWIKENFPNLPSDRLDVILNACIVIFSDEKRLYSATGFIFDEDERNYYAVTAGHVLQRVDNKNKIVIESSQGRVYGRALASRYPKNTSYSFFLPPHSDIGIIMIDKECFARPLIPLKHLSKYSRKDFPIGKMSLLKEEAEGKNVFILGNFMRTVGPARAVIGKAWRVAGSATLKIYGKGITYGFSGSPVIDETGNVIGVLHALSYGHPGSLGLSIANDVTYIKKFLTESLATIRSSPIQLQPAGLPIARTSATSVSKSDVVFFPMSRENIIKYKKELLDIEARIFGETQCPFQRFLGNSEGEEDALRVEEKFSEFIFVKGELAGYIVGHMDSVKNWNVQPLSGKEVVYSIDSALRLRRIGVLDKYRKQNLARQAINRMSQKALKRSVTKIFGRTRVDLAQSVIETKQSFLESMGFHPIGRVFIKGYPSTVWEGGAEAIFDTTRTSPLSDHELFLKDARENIDNARGLLLEMRSLALSRQPSDIKLMREKIRQCNETLSYYWGSVSSYYKYRENTRGIRKVIDFCITSNQLLKALHYWLLRGDLTPVDISNLLQCLNNVQGVLDRFEKIINNGLIPYYEKEIEMDSVVYHPISDYVLTHENTIKVNIQHAEIWGFPGRHGGYVRIKTIPEYYNYRDAALVMALRTSLPDEHRELPSTSPAVTLPAPAPLLDMPSLEEAVRSSPSLLDEV